ncbi:MAG: quercetin dioxygenase-like cupin family protein [Candidatus Azotimanducaceae bacterium]
MSVSYNPEFNPTGIEGGLDTNEMPWLSLPQASGMSIKPLRASSESGMFSMIIKLNAGTKLSDLVFLGAMDLMMLSGELEFPDGELASKIGPGIWGYIPANARVASIVAASDTEFLANCFGPLAFLKPKSQHIRHLLTAMDVAQIANEHGVTLVPNTLAECMQDRPGTQLPDATPLAIAGDAAPEMLAKIEASTFASVNPHFVDTRDVPWIVNPGLPDIALKILRVSEETGVTSLIVRHNGVAGPHYHLGAADFLVLSGRIGYRAGPPEGYGAGVWFFEPAGARHEATQRIGEEEDLIYTANVYGPVQFDDGPGTPIAAIQSWMQYKELADASGVKLVQNTFAGDASLLAWSSLGG